MFLVTVIGNWFLGQPQAVLVICGEPVVLAILAFGRLINLMVLVLLLVMLVLLVIFCWVLHQQRLVKPVVLSSLMDI